MGAIYRLCDVQKKGFRRRKKLRCGGRLMGGISRPRRPRTPQKKCFNAQKMVGPRPINEYHISAPRYTQKRGFNVGKSSVRWPINGGHISAPWCTKKKAFNGGKIGGAGAN